MVVKDLNGEEYIWKHKGKELSKNASQLHIKARDLLKEVFPTSKFIEEVAFTPKLGYRTTLFLDFYNTLFKIAIEVQGQQHFSKSTLFDKNKLTPFIRQKNDELKREWCLINNIKLVYLNYNEDMNVWRKRLCKTKDG